MNAAKRHVLQRGAVAADRWAADLLAWGKANEAMGAQLHRDVADAAYLSIVQGSSVTGAPGQPVDTGELRDSWKMRFLSPTLIEIYTTNPYARAIEHNWRRIRKSAIKAYKATHRIKRMTKAKTSALRKSLGGLQFRSGGAHSVKLTRMGFRRLVERVAGVTR